MRFHIGLSLNWNTLKKWILPIFLGILAYLGFSCLSVKAYTFENVGYISDSSVVVTYSNGSDTGKTLDRGVIYDVGFVNGITINIDYNFSVNTVYQLEFYTYTGSMNLNNITPILLQDSTNVCEVLEQRVDSTSFYKINFKCSNAIDTLNVFLQPNDANTSIINGTSLQYNYLYLSKALSSYEEDVLNQNQTIIDQNGQIIDGQDQIKDEIGNVGEQIEDSIGNAKDEINDTIKDQFNSCRDSVNLFNPNNILPLGFGNNLLSEFSSYKSFYLPCKPGDVFSVSRNDLSNNRFRVMFSSDFPANNVPIFGGTGNTTKYDSALNIENIVAPENANYIIVYLTNINSPLPSELQIQKGPNSTKYEPFGEEICSNKIDDTNDQLGNLNDNITNPDIDSGSANSFFDNFKTEDNGGISGIITAPLRLINSLLDNQGTCTDLRFPIMGKEVAIPSGCIIWDKVPNQIEILIQTLVCGTGAYFLLRELFKDIEKLKNPNNSEVSTLDL